MVNFLLYCLGMPAFLCCVPCHNQETSTKKEALRQMDLLFYDHFGLLGSGKLSLWRSNIQSEVDYFLLHFDPQVFHLKAKELFIHTSPYLTSLTLIELYSLETEVILPSFCIVSVITQAQRYF